MFKEICKILDNTQVAPGHYALKLDSARIAGLARPGQFVQVLCSSATDPLLPRPFSFLTATDKYFSLLYQTVGKGTRMLSGLKKGGSFCVVGPLGNGFTADIRRRADKIINTVYLVGGGVGIPPLYHLAEHFLKQGDLAAENIHVMLGARNRAYLLCEREFKKLGVILSVATDDGSKGKKGFVTTLLEEALKKANPVRTRIFTCGPTPMLKAVSAGAKRNGVSCEVSVEVPMACGFGACLGCAIKITGKREEGRGERVGFRYAMACCEGPVFQAKDILWE